MAFSQEIFRSYDIRGKLDEVTEDVARKVGEALVTQKGARTVILGRDMRSTSPALAKAVAEGVTAMGGNVVDIGLCTTSLYNYAVSTIAGADVGVMVTASHNPAAYNGIKVNMASSMPVPGKELWNIVQAPSTPVGEPGHVREENVRDAYLEKCFTLAGSPNLGGARVVVDYGNGMGVMTIRDLLTRMNAEVIELYPEPDANFPNHDANPAVEETLEDLKREVIARKADLGIALDGDVDRLKIIDEQGRSVATDLTLALLSDTLVREVPGSKVVITMNMSHATRDAITHAGGQVVECPIGRTNVISAMLKEGALLGGEVSGHMMFNAFANLECIDFAVARLLGFWKTSGKPFSELVSPFATYANSGEVNRDVHDKAAVLALIESTYAPQATQTSKLDGIRCEFGNDWWFIVRPSNTEPVLRLTVEAQTRELMEAKREELVRLMESVK